MAKKHGVRSSHDTGLFVRTFRRARRWSLIAFGLATLTYAGLDLVDYTLEADLFLVEEVVVEGTCLIAEDEILEVMDIPALIRLWKIEPEELEARILTLGLVRNVDVRRVLPHTLVVEVEERAPVAVIHDPKTGRRLALDEEAVVLFDAAGREGDLALASGHPAGTMPEVIGIEDEGWRPGEPVAVGRLKDLLRAVALAAAREEPWALSLSAIETPRDPRGWVLRSGDFSGEIRLGDRSFIERIGRIDPVHRFIKDEGLELTYLDLRFDQQIVIKPVSCPPEKWMEIASRHPEPGGAKDSV